MDKKELEDYIDSYLQQKIGGSEIIQDHQIDNYDEPPMPAHSTRKEGRQLPGSRHNLSANIDIELWNLLKIESRKHAGVISRTLDVVLWRYFRKPKLSFELEEKMPRILNAFTSFRDISECMESFKNTMTRNAQRIPDCVIGYKGGNAKNTVHWRSDLNIWSAFGLGVNRHWCPFGIEDPQKKKNNLNMVCEINFPFENKNLRIAGAFGCDENGTKYITHNGGVGGGRPGISKSKFLEFYGDSSMVTLKWPNGEESESILLGGLEDSDLDIKIRDFVRKVAEFKVNIAGK